MKLPRCQDLVFTEGVFPESVADESRIVIWRKTDREGSFQYWERIGSVARAPVATQNGLCATAATSIRAREWIGGALGKILHRLRERKGNRAFPLPNGRSADQCGERQADFLLVWADDDGQIPNEAVIKEEWPEAKRLDRLSEKLYLVAGVATEADRTKAAAKAADSTQPLSDATPRKMPKGASQRRARPATALRKSSH